MRVLAGVRTLREAKCGARAGASRREAARTAECSRAVERKLRRGRPDTACRYLYALMNPPELSLRAF